MQQYVCVHCHFYQPPRENAWLEAIELQDSAHPFHDWNARITAECYAPNGASRIVNWDGQIEQIINNYARISFNVGPTLLAWLEEESPDVYQAILDADAESQELFDGHGSAMAQAYNHMILPLANTRDKYTQILWGIRDFQQRFGRDPKGMWLPETAVDLESLDIMAELGIEYTIFSPFQAQSVREIGEEEWEDAHGGNVDPTRPYLINLPSGRTIAGFFYDGPISQGVAFEGLLSSGEKLADRLMSGFDDERDWPQILHIATDGESYGHHHRHGDMALAYALHVINEREDVQLTNYAAYLAENEITHEALVYDDSSWSCVHGIERWRSDCGCNSGGHDWHQRWRAPLRDSLDWLRDHLIDQYEDAAKPLMKDPWKARDEFIDVILDRSTENVDAFLGRHAGRELSGEEKITALKLLEMQRHAMLMYTSCGWFFDDLSGIETVQVIQYAGRTVQLAQELFGDSIEEKFLERLEEAPSNVREHKNGRVIYDKMVKPAMVDLEKVGAHYAISSLFEEYGPETEVFCYLAELLDSEELAAGRASMTTGQVKLTSRITSESEELAFGVAHFGDHNLLGGVRPFRTLSSYQEMQEDLSDQFKRAEFPELVRAIDRHFKSNNYSIRSLFRDEQRKILDIILNSTLEETAAVYRHLHEDNQTLMHFLADINAPLPDAFELTSEFVINLRLRELFQEPELNFDEIEHLLNQVRQWSIKLDSEELGYVLAQTIDSLAVEFGENPESLELLDQLDDAVELAVELPFEVNLWRSQNIYWDILQNRYQELIERGSDDEELNNWIEKFQELGERLSVEVDA